MNVIADVNSHNIANADDSVSGKNKTAIHALQEIVTTTEELATNLRDSGNI